MEGQPVRARATTGSGPRAHRETWLAVDMWRAQREGASGLRRRREARLRALVEHARRHSPLFADLYATVPAEAWRLGDLPSTSKPDLMTEFDAWVTDRRLTRQRVADFVADPTLVGESLGPAEFVCTSSGTTGIPGLFVHDAAAVRTYWVEPIVRGYGLWFGPATFARFLRNGGRDAQVIGIGAHFGGAAWARLGSRRSSMARRAVAVFDARQPIHQLVQQLAAFRPAVLAGYGSLMEQLAAEADAGRLDIEPMLVATAGENISELAQKRIAAAFGCMVRDSYAASETLFMAHSCAHGLLHVSSDWFILEPVDEDGSPTALGHFSHTVWVTNLANRLQPVIRYDLGDSVQISAEPCACGSPLPGIRVAGRSGDFLTLQDVRGHEVAIGSMVVGTALDRVSGALHAQVLQRASGDIEIRFAIADAGDHQATVANQAERRLATGTQLQRALLEALEAGGAHRPRVRLVDDPPLFRGRGGKFRRVITA